MGVRPTESAEPKMGDLGKIYLSLTLLVRSCGAGPMVMLGAGALESSRSLGSVRLGAHARWLHQGDRFMVLVSLRRFWCGGF